MQLVASMAVTAQRCWARTVGHRTLGARMEILVGLAGAYLDAHPAGILLHLSHGL